LKYFNYNQYAGGKSILIFKPEGLQVLHEAFLKMDKMDYTNGTFFERFFFK